MADTLIADRVAAVPRSALVAGFNHVATVTHVLDLPGPQQQRVVPRLEHFAMQTAGDAALLVTARRSSARKAGAVSGRFREQGGCP